ncbi:hypothetical protein ABIC08_007736 [Bradyrhizobium sp. RT9b]|uniref:hypothetical protein n=1 Tax=unclassified Bradyrhizobium TaxID=2631580 RepID=UPI003394DB46
MTLRLRRIPKRWKSSAGLRALLASGAAREWKTEEHDAQVELFRDHIWPRLVDDAVAFAIGNGGKRHPKVAKEMKEEGVTPARQTSSSSARGKRSSLR